MRTFDFANVQEPKSAQRLEPGIHLVKIVSVEDVTPEDTTKSPYITLSVEGEQGTVDLNFYMSEKAASISLGKMKHIFMAALGSEEAVAKLSSLEVIQKVVVGKSFWLKLSGEELTKSDGSGTFIKAKVAWTPFAERFVKDQQPTTLKFDAKYDITKAAVAPGMKPAEITSMSSSLVDSSDLPF